MNETIIQVFHWYTRPEERLWHTLSKTANELAGLGFTHAWMPPAFKSAQGTEEPGYATYDLYDLGEFDQKGTKATRYGDVQEYLAAIDSLHKAGMKVLADVVLNHKSGGDEEEAIPVVTVDSEDRQRWISEEHQVKTRSRFTFPGRQGKYSPYVWDHRSFSGFKQDEEIKLIRHEYTNQGWGDVPATDHGSFDYLIGFDVEFRNPFVREELKRWAKWYIETARIDGFRLDAVKHIDYSFFPEWLDAIRPSFREPPFIMGEYWKKKPAQLLDYIERVGYRMRLVDAPLHSRFFEAGGNPSSYDLRTLEDETFVNAKPDHAITFVDNHDTQPLQALESFVAPSFKPLAYAYILLREEGVPCVFCADLYGTSYTDLREGQRVEIRIDKTPLLPEMIRIRKEKAYGLQRHYPFSASLIGWTRQGEDDRNGSGCAVLLNTGHQNEVEMEMGKMHGGQTMTALGQDNLHVILDADGKGRFHALANAVTIYTFK